MGYSASAKALDKEATWAQTCHQQTGQSNMYEVRGTRYFYQIGREQRDGAVTGSVFRMLEDGRCVRSGSFRIESDGTVSKHPTGFTQLQKGNN